MTQNEKRYIAIDLKSFYASVECVERGLDPLDANLVVADPTRTEKTICLAVSPSLKAYGIGGRARLFEVVQKMTEVNARRKSRIKGDFTGESTSAAELAANPKLKAEYIIAPPRMAKYMKISTEIYNVYLKYIAPEDIHVYSIDEVFIDAAAYLKTYGMTARELAVKMIKDVLEQTGVTATAGIGTNLYLCKIAMDIVAKKMPADKDGVRIAELDEMSYRRELWHHRPLTDFWRIGKGYAAKLESQGLYTMGDIARCSLGSPREYYNEGLLYRLFGVNAELLIDHAWGCEPCRISDIKEYRPANNSISSGQVLQCPYDFEKGRLIVREMTDLLSLDLVEKGLVTDKIVLTVIYDTENLNTPEKMKEYKGEIAADSYGRKAPKPAHGTSALGCYTSSTRIIVEKMTELYEKIIDRNLTIRKVYVVAANVIREADVKKETSVQLDFFTDYEELEKREAEEAEMLEKEKSMQKALISIKKKYGKNAVLKGMNLEEGATAKQRNEQVGGHKA